MEDPAALLQLICRETHEQNHDTAHRCVRLPVLKEDGQNYASVDAHCAICLGEYEAGDQIVWSALECRHAFHSECILPWLAKGKKRCPCCRHWFVPGTKIDDQKAALLAGAEPSSNSLDEEEVEEMAVESQQQQQPAGGGESQQPEVVRPRIHSV